MEIKVDSLRDTQNLISFLNSKNIRSYSIFDKVPFFDWSGWNQFSLAEEGSYFYADDPRNLPIYGKFKNLYLDRDGKHIIYIQKTENPYKDRFLIKDLPDYAKPVNQSAMLFLGLGSFLALLSLLFVPQTKPSRGAILIFSVLLFFTDPVLSPLFPLLFMSRLFGVPQKNKFQLLMNLIVLLVLFMISILYERPLFFFLCSFSFLSVEILKSEQATKGMDHTLFVPLLLVTENKKINSSRVHPFYLFLAITLFVFSFALINHNNKNDHPSLSSFPVDSGGIMDEFYSDLSLEKSFFSTRTEDWTKPRIDEEKLAIQNELKDFWKDQGEDSLIQHLELGHEYRRIDNKISYIFLILYLIIWLTMPVSLWQSRKTFSHHENFVFKIKRRLEVA